MPGGDQKGNTYMYSNWTSVASFPDLPCFFSFFGLCSASVYYTECKPKNKKKYGEGLGTRLRTNGRPHYNVIIGTG